MKFAALAIGYNRIPGMLRALKSLEDAYYAEDTMDLIISVDNCGYDAVAEAARAFHWSHGEKIVRTFSERQGLRKHILSCGDFLEEYDALVVLEDDIVVSPAYYEYMKQAVAFYKDNSDIAGIALFSRDLSGCLKPFTPEASAYDVYYMQYPQSWGQIWMKNQWFAFREWYEEHKDDDLDSVYYPKSMSDYPATSWAKYHGKYCVDCDKYFVYPYHALSTCYADVGAHTQEMDLFAQVPMLYQLGKQYRLCDDKEKMTVYDVFFERMGMERYLDLPEGSLWMDLYGARTRYEGKRYLLSTKSLPYHLMKSFGLLLRPHECNIKMGIEGSAIHLYDLEQPTEKPAAGINIYNFIEYYYKLRLTKRQLMAYFRNRIKSLLNKIRKRIF